MIKRLATASFLLATVLGKYYKKIDEKVQFIDANAKCQEIYGTDLASIHSDIDWESALATCGSSGPCWLGGVHGSVDKNGDQTTYQISTDYQNDNWQWMDGSQWDYENWGEFGVNKVPQGQGLTGEHFTCIWQVWHQQNAAGVGDCGNGQIYPICDAPSPIKCEATQACTWKELAAEYVYCTGYRACANSQIKTDNLFIQGHRSVEMAAQITASNILCYGSMASSGAYMYSDGIDVMTARFYGFLCGNNALLHCADGSICNIYCDGKFGCEGLTVRVDDDSTININPPACQLSGNQNAVINGVNVKCPKVIEHI